jgi:hypothetical protein
MEMIDDAVQVCPDFDDFPSDEWILKTLPSTDSHYLSDSGFHCFLMWKIKQMNYDITQLLLDDFGVFGGVNVKMLQKF